MPRAASAVTAAGAVAAAGSPYLKTKLPRIKHTILNRVRLTDTTVFAKASGTGTGTTDTTAPLWPGQASHVRLTGHGTTGAYFGVTLATPWDFTSSYPRFVGRVNNYSYGKTLQFGLATTKAAFTAGNYIRYQSKANSSVAQLANWWFANTWVWDAQAPSLMATLGSGANLASIGYIVILVSDQASSPSTVWDFAEIQQIQSVGTKAKCVIWHDDSVPTGGAAIHDRMQAKGWVASYATEFESITSLTSGFPIANYRAEGGTFGLHAETPAEHIDVDSPSFQDQIRRYKPQDFKFLNNGYGADFTYWGSLRGAIAYPILKDHMRSGRFNTAVLAVPDQQPPADPFDMKALLAQTVDTFAANWQPLIDNAITCKGIAQLVFHQDVASNSTFAAQFDALLTYLDGKRDVIDVVTLPQALAASVA